MSDEELQAILDRNDHAVNKTHQGRVQRGSDWQLQRLHSRQGRAPTVPSSRPILVLLPHPMFLPS